MSARLGLDIGGTFTDAVGVLDGNLVWAKAETTHHDLKDCFMEAAARAAERLGSDLATVARDAEALIYSTTVGTNTLIERTGPQAGASDDDGVRGHAQGGAVAQLGRRDAAGSPVREGPRTQA